MLFSSVYSSGNGDSGDGGLSIDASVVSFYLPEVSILPEFALIVSAFDAILGKKTIATAKLCIFLKCVFCPDALMIICIPCTHVHFIF